MPEKGTNEAQNVNKLGTFRECQKFDTGINILGILEKINLHNIVMQVAPYCLYLVIFWEQNGNS